MSVFPTVSSPAASLSQVLGISDALSSPMTQKTINPVGLLPFSPNSVYVPPCPLDPALVQQLFQTLKTDANSLEHVSQPKPEPVKPLPVDKAFISMLDALKPEPLVLHKPDGPQSQLELKKFHAHRMREYRRKSTETLAKSKAMMDGLALQLSCNCIRLKSILTSNLTVNEVKMEVAKKLRLDDVEKVILVDEVRAILNKFEQRKRIASESHEEGKSLFFLDRLNNLQRRAQMQTGPGKSPTDAYKKVKDAMMKARSYDMYMDDKRVRKVIAEFEKIEQKLRDEITVWIAAQDNC